MIPSPLTRKIFVVYLITAVVMMGVYPAKIFPANEANKKKDDLLIYTYGDSGEEFKIDQGKEFEIHFSENPTTGFLWTILDLPPNIQFIDKKFIRNDASSVVGAGGLRIFIFKALNPGKAELRFVLKRSWEKEDKHADIYLLKLLIE
jgi:predicted secreted protein